MSILNEIAMIIHPSCEITGQDKKKLEEAQEAMVVNLKTKGQYLLYDFEKITGGDPYPFFQDKEGLKAIADYVLFAQKKQTLYVLVFELKKGRKTPKPQLYATKAFMEFIMKRITYLNTSLSFDVQYRMIGISKNVRKKTSKKVYDGQGYCSFSGSQLTLDIYLQ